MLSLPVVLLTLGSGTASATTYTGANYLGADLILANGDELTGAFTDVGAFVVPAGALVTVTPRVPLVVYADSITIQGQLNANGGGYLGGEGAPGGALDGEPGFGFSAGEGGEDGYCVHGGGGGGGGFGGLGGTGGHYFGPQTGFGGLAFGLLDDPLDRPLGSGGGGGGSDCYHDAGPGGPGGGSILLVASSVTIQGSVVAIGGSAPDLITGWSGGGGGGSGGSIVIYAGSVDGGGTVAANGGRGGSPPLGVGNYGGGGGGGSGGRVKVWMSTLGPLTIQAPGSGNGTDQAFLAVPSTPGGAGSVYVAFADGDMDTDGIDLPTDNCPFVDNPTQDDGDGDGVGDLCDPCPSDVSGDSDGDGVCDTDDLCPGFDDSIDSDGDGFPDDCDDCPNDSPDDSDGDGVCNSADLCDGGDDTFDVDGDDVPDDCDLCPDVADPAQIDTDLDGVGDLCDCAPSDPLGGNADYETCDGVDNDCNGLTDEAGAIGEQIWYADFDNDGHGDSSNTVLACDPPAGFVDNQLDCDDSSSVVGPFQAEFCDGRDNDCDGVVDPPELQCDGGSDDEKGCGCATPASSPAGLLWLGLLAVVGRRRR